jgi:hypothetical protein
MNEKDRRRVATELLDNLDNVLPAVERMPEDCYATEISWYPAHRADLLAEPRGDRLRRLAYEHWMRSRTL